MQKHLFDFLFFINNLNKRSQKNKEKKNKKLNIKKCLHTFIVNRVI